MSKSSIGRLSVGLILTMFVLLTLGMSLTNTLYPATPAGETLWEDLQARPVLAICMLLGFASGISAFLTGLLAILREKDRSFWVFVSSIIGALLLVFLIAEFLFPH